MEVRAPESVRENSIAFRRKIVQERGMTTRFLPYNPDQAYLLPPNVKDVLGPDHLAFFVHRVVERLDVEEFTRAYGEEADPFMRRS